jgi:hypothetical protein
MSCLIIGKVEKSLIVELQNFLVQKSISVCCLKSYADINFDIADLYDNAHDIVNVELLVVDFESLHVDDISTISYIR